MNYSYNSGKPIEKVVVPTLSQAVALIRTLQYGSKIFRADFVKRGDGSMRTMVCRCGVRKYLKGGATAYNFSDKGLLSVFEYGKGYRSIPLDNLIRIKYAGVLYVFDPDLRPGEVNVNPGKKRTISAYTSPLLPEHSLAEMN